LSNDNKGAVTKTRDKSLIKENGMNNHNRMNAVVHFEMPYEDRDRMVTFYETVFGWKMTKLGADMMDYVVARTAEPSKEHDEQYKENARGTIGGGFYQKKPDWPAQYPSQLGHC
jgi:uncharacterized protein